MEFYAAMKKHEILSFSSKWMESKWMESKSMNQLKNGQLNLIELSQKKKFKWQKST
jgi:hypothetical protein